MEETETRLDFDALVPRFSAAMSRLDAVAGQGLDPRLRELAAAAVRASFAPDDVRTRVLAEIDHS